MIFISLIISLFFNECLQCVISSYFLKSDIKKKNEILEYAKYMERMLLIHDHIFSVTLCECVTVHDFQSLQIAVH